MVSLSFAHHAAPLSAHRKQDFSSSAMWSLLHAARPADALVMLSTPIPYDPGVDRAPRLSRETKSKSPTLGSSRPASRAAPVPHQGAHSAGSYRRLWAAGARGPPKASLRSTKKRGTPGATRRGLRDTKASVTFGESSGKAEPSRWSSELGCQTQQSPDSQVSGAVTRWGVARPWLGRAGGGVSV